MRGAVVVPLVPFAKLAKRTIHPQPENVASFLVWHFFAWDAGSLPAMVERGLAAREEGEVMALR